MASKFETQLQKIQQHPVTAILGVVGSALIAVIILGYWLNWHWTGLVEETSEPIQRVKTLWDWLLLLIIPLLLAVGGLWFNQIQKSRDQNTTEQRAKAERETVADNQRGRALQAYLDKMSELLLEKKLRDSVEEEDEVRKIARVRTLTVLHGLDPIRKAGIIQFLHESSLIDKDKRIISLSGADLSRANLSGAKLIDADLSRANLSRANLSRANLSGAKLIDASLREATLSRATLSGAILDRADLSGADLSGATLDRANLSGATLDRADLSGAILDRADLSGADLSDINLKDAKLSGVNLSHTLLGRASLSYADLSGANLSDTNLSRANLSDANLSDANLSGADLNDADLSRANLSGATLSRASLSEADLSGADLSGATLSNANLKGAIGITVEELKKQAKSLQGATMPDGFIV